MKIAAQLTGNDVVVFMEEATWKKATLPLNNQVVSTDLIVYIINDAHIFHDAISRPEPDTDASLIFCRQKITVANLKNELNTAGCVDPPYEVRLSNALFSLRKEFVDAYSIRYMDYTNNSAFKDWLSMLPGLEGSFLLQRVFHTGRYYSRDFSEFREYDSIREFIRDRFVMWYETTVDEYEADLAKTESDI
jgi:hypothetical protein